MKTHYVMPHPTNVQEGQNRDGWDDIWCGIKNETKSPTTNIKDKVTCKNCLKVISGYDKWIASLPF